MCGIVGLYHFNSSPFNPSILKKMANTLIHRGPEGDGYWMTNDNRLGFGHRRLAIIDLSDHGKQPMLYEHLSITFNGEIYNYIELKESLIKKGYQFTTNTDTEVILIAYIEYGEKCLEYLDGMFAFVIWDEQKKELFGARDRFGEKPLYYYLDNEKFVFGSEMKAIFASGIPIDTNKRMLFHYLAYNIVENPNAKEETFYQNIFQVPASHCFKISINGDIRFKKYWDIRYDYKQEISLNNAKEKFLELFESSISKRLRTDVKFGCSFSGGIDSSSIVSTIIDKNPGIDLNTFTARFKNINYDENYFIECLQNKFKFKSHYCWPSEDSVINEIDKIFYHQEEPFGSTSIMAQWDVMKLARTNNTIVLLDGQGADETLGGYFKNYLPFLSELRLSSKDNYKKQKKAIQEFTKTDNILPRNFYMNTFATKTINKISSKIRPYRLLNETKHINPEFIRPFINETPPFRHINNLSEFLHFDTFNYGLGKLLRFSDRNSMAHSVEVRLPYLSHELVQFAFSLPSEMKFNNGWTKYLLRSSMENRLPSEICWRKDKKGFQTPETWLQHPKVKELLKDSIETLKQERILTNDSNLNGSEWQMLMASKLLLIKHF